MAFHARLLAERAAAGRRTLSQLIGRALEQSGYAEHVLTLSDGARRLANVRKLLRVARRHEASEGRGLRGFLDHVAHHQEGLSGAEPDAPVAAGETEAVRLMSIHAAKGLEFDVVCVADLGRAQNLGVGDLLVDGERVGLRLARLDGSEATPSLAWSELAEERRLAQAEEEDRILYVAMTRARERLLLSGAVDFERWPEQRPGGPTISWLGPALSPELPANVQVLEPPIRELSVGAGDRRSAVRVALRLNAPETAGTVIRLDRPPDASDGDSLRHPRTDPAPSRGDPVASAAECRLRPLALRRSGATRDAQLHLAHRAPRCSYRFYLERVLGLPEQHPPEGAAGSPVGAAWRLARAARSSTGCSSRSTSRPPPPRPRRMWRGSPASSVCGSHPRSAGSSRSCCARRSTPRWRRALRRSLPARAGSTHSRSRSSRRAVEARCRRVPAEAAEEEEEEVLLTGVLDLLVAEPGEGMLVVDYKSDRVAPEEDLGDLVEREYAIQRLLYALAVLAEGAPRVEIVHWFLHRPSEPIGAVFLAGDRPRLEDAIARLVRSARARSFTVSRRSRSRSLPTCPGRAGLCSWSDAMTLREPQAVAR